MSECESQLCIEYTHEYRVICILNEANVTAGQVTNNEGNEGNVGVVGREWS